MFYIIFTVWDWPGSLNEDAKMENITVKAYINEHNEPVVCFQGPYQTVWKRYSTITAAKRAAKTTWSNKEKAYQFWITA